MELGRSHCLSEGCPASRAIRHGDAPQHGLHGSACRTKKRGQGAVIPSRPRQLADVRPREASLLPGRWHGCARPRSNTLLSATLPRSGRTTSRGISKSSTLFDVDASGVASPATAAGLSCSLCSGGAQPGSGAQAAPGAQQVFAGRSTAPGRQAQQKETRLAALQQKPGRCRSSNNSCTAAAEAGRSTAPGQGSGGVKARRHKASTSTQCLSNKTLTLWVATRPELVSTHLHLLCLSTKSTMRSFPAACFCPGSCCAS